MQVCALVVGFIGGAVLAFVFWQFHGFALWSATLLGLAGTGVTTFVLGLLGRSGAPSGAVERGDSG